MDNLKVQKSLCAASLLAVLSIGVPAYADGETPNPAKDLTINNYLNIPTIAPATRAVVHDEIFDTVNGAIEETTLENWTSDTASSIMFDADLANNVSDSINITGTAESTVKLMGINIYSDSTTKDNTITLFKNGISPDIDISNYIQYTNDRKYVVTKGNAGELVLKGYNINGGFKNAIEDTSVNRTFSSTGNTMSPDNHNAMGGSNLSIYGNGWDFTYTGDSTASNIIYLTDGKSVYIDNVKIENGPIYAVNSQTVIKDSYLKHISAEGGTINISNSTFENLQSAVTSGNANAAAFWTNSNSKITDSTFKNNSVSNSGDGMAYGSAIETLASAVIFGTTFENNYAKSETAGSAIGGAIYINPASTSTSIYDSVFENNSAQNANATSKGGAVYNSSTLYLSGTEFSGNTSSFGGAIYDTSSAYVVNSVFNANSAGSNAGAIHHSNGALTVGNSTFTGNDAICGGAMYIYSGTATIGSTVFGGESAEYGNTAVNNGGAICMEDATVNIYDSIFSYNQADNGAAIYKSGGTLNIYGSTFENNTAGSSGIIVNTDGNLNIKNSTFANNAANNGHGVINSSTGIVNITNSKFLENTAESTAVVDADSADLYIENSIFEGNTSNTKAIIGKGVQGHLVIKNSIFKNNTIENINSNQNGGIIQNYSSDATIIADGGITEFSGNLINGQSNSITNTSSASVLYLNASKSGSFIINDNISSTYKSNININATHPLFDGTSAPTDGNIQMNGKFIGSSVILNNGSLTLGEYGQNSTGYFENSDLTINGGTLNIANGTVDTIDLNNFSATGGSVILDLAGENKTYDKFNISGTTSGTLNIGAVNVTSELNNTYGAPGRINLDLFLPDNAPALTVGSNTYTNNYLYEITNSSTAGSLSVNQLDITQKIDSVLADANTAVKVFTLSGNLKNTSDLGSMPGGTLILDGGGFDWDGNSHAGLSVSSGSFLVMDGFGYVDENGNIINSIHDFVLDGSGSVLNLSGIASISNSVFYNNKITAISAQGYDGGAIRMNTGSKLYLNNVIFDTISAEGTASGGGVIGAYGDTIIRGSTFNNNSTNYIGGAIYVKNVDLRVFDTTFTNNTARIRGGAIHFSGDGLIFGSTFDKNQTTSSHGGAIANEANLHISDSTFTNNSTSMTTATYGGAVYNASNLTVSGSTFTNNAVPNILATDTTAEVKGEAGAIFNNGTMAINNSVFTGNIGFEGGAISLGADSYTTITNSTFDSNTAYGGGVFDNAGDSSSMHYLSIYDSTFTGNSATSGSGGVFRFASSNTFIYGSSFENNSTTIYGGAVSLAGSGNSYIIDSIFTQNTSPQNGNAIYVGGGKLTIMGSTFTENQGTTGSGAIYNVSNLVVMDSVFDNNSGNTGAAIKNTGGSLTVMNTDITNNTGQNAWAGVITNVTTNGKVQINNSTFDANTGTRTIYNVAQGAVVIVNNSTFTNHNNNSDDGFASVLYSGGMGYSGNYASVCNSTFTDNTAKNAGALYGVNAINSIFKNNTATVEIGGAGSSIYAYNSVFENNSAVTSGGAIFRSPVVANSVFKDNHAGINGGALAIKETDTTISSSIFSHNYTTDTENDGSSDYGGGAIYFKGINSDNTVYTLNINRSEFENNAVARGSGSAIRQEQGIMNINASTFTNNTGGDGAVYINNGSTANINNSTFTGNSRAICNQHGSNTTINNSIFTGNYSNFGGAIHNDMDGATMTINSSRFYDNYALSYNINAAGGALYSHSSNDSNTSYMYVNNSIFSANMGQNGGAAYGAIYFNGSIFDSNGIIEDAYGKNTDRGGAVRGSNIKNSILKNNTAGYGGALVYGSAQNSLFLNNAAIQRETNADGVTTGNGGAIYYIATNSITSNGLAFIGNHADGYGGAVYMADNSKLAFTGSLFKENYSRQGGAIFAGKDTSLTLDYTRFLSNYTQTTIADNEDDGGAILSMGELTINHSAFNSNSAKGGMGTAAHGANGGNIWHSNGKLTINYSALTGNSAPERGGGAMYALSEVEAALSSFDGNSAGLNGGAAFLNGNSIFYSSTFYNNTAESNGGAAYLTAATAQFMGSVFKNNTADKGGAIFNDNSSSLKVFLSYFGGNTASTTGGAITNTNNSTAKILNSVFENNTAGDGTDGMGDGGAFANYSNSTLTIQNAVIKNNKSYDDGGAIDNRATLNIIGNGGAVFFSGNKSKNDVSKAIANLGGVVNLNAGNGGIVRFDDVIGGSTRTDAININQSGIIGYDGTAAPTDGIVIFNHQISNATINVYNGMLTLGQWGRTPDTSNTTINLYGGIFSTANGSLSDTSQTINIAGNAGVMFDMKWGSSANVEPTKYSVTSGSPFIAGINITSYTDSGTSGFDSGRWNGLDVTNYGGTYTNSSKVYFYRQSGRNGVYSTKTSDSYSLGNAFENTSAYKAFSATADFEYGQSRNSTLSTGMLTIFGNQHSFTFNQSSNIYRFAMGSNTTLNIFGVGKYNYDTGTVEAAWQNNNDTVGEGIIGGWAATNATLNIADSVFYNNKTSTNGAVLQFGHGASGTSSSVGNGKLTINHSVFASNHALGSCGGVMELGGTGTYTTILDSLFKDNTAVTAGGAIILYYGNLHVSSSEFTGNTSGSSSTEGNGGAIFATNNSNVTILSSIFNNNKVLSNNSGGALCTTSRVNMNIVDSSFTGNSAYNGGAISNFGVMNIVHSDFTNNTATSVGAYYGGGAIFNADRMDVVGSTFTGNKAYDGSAITNRGILSVIKSDFINNVTTSSGTIYNYANAQLEVVDSLFSGNTAGGGGGIGAHGTANITNSQFLNNYASGSEVGGGAIYAHANSDYKINASEFSGNHAYSFGGAIYVHHNESINGTAYDAGKIAVYNSTFDGNYSKKGGAIFMRSGSTASIYNSDFLNNYITDPSNANINGGAIFNNNGTLTVVNSNFSGNYTKDYATSSTGSNTGGAISSSGSGSVTNITNSTFTNNSAYGGGAVEAWTGKMTITTSDFVGNWATNNGGAISASNGTILEVNTSTFKGNYTSDPSGNGGAIGVYDVNATINNSIFGGTGDGEGNTAKNGGAIYFEPTKNTGSGSLTINGSDFINNHATNSAGAIYQAGGTLTVNGSLFDGNSAINNSNGGAISSFGSGKLIIDGSKFLNNTSYAAADNHSGDGGAIYTSAGYETVIKNSYFENNIAVESSLSNDGGAIILYGSKAEISDTEFYANKASHYGGAAYMSTVTSIWKQVNFIDNEAKHYGGAINFEARGGGATAEFYNSKFYGNKSGNLGGAIYNGITLSITNSIFGAEGDDKGNTSKANGGAIYSSGNLTITGSQFINNSATGITGQTVYGGAISNTGELNINNSVFKGNSVGSSGMAGHGGAINQNGSSATITNSSFESNISTTDGGAIRLGYNTNVTISATEFIKNHTSNYGGAICGSESIDTITNSIFKQNSAAYGGAIGKSGGTTTINDSIFESNSGNLGGALYAFSQATYNINNSTFSKNEASGNGGAIYNTSSTINIADSVFDSNHSANNGAAISNYGTMTVKNSVFKNNDSYYSAIFNNGTLDIISESGKSTIFTGNNSEQYGGAVTNANGQTLTFTANAGSSLLFENNTAAMGGGAINNTESGSSVVINGAAGSLIEFNNNSAGFGSAIYNTRNFNITADTIKFVGNTTLDSGSTSPSGNHDGTIYNSGTMAIDANSAIFVGNTATRGGAIYNTGTLSLNNGYFKGNSALDGGAVQNYNGNIVISNSIFEGNTATAGYGGALYNQNGNVTLINTSFYDNKAHSSSAIVNYGTLNIIADDGISEFKGNLRSNGNIYRAISNGSSTLSTVVNLNAGNNGRIAFYDAIHNAATININKTGIKLADGSTDAPTDGEIYIANTIQNLDGTDSTINLYNGTLTLAKEEYLSDGTQNLNLNGGVLNLINNKIGTVVVNDFSSSADAKLNIDANLQSGQNGYGQSDNITVNGTFAPSSAIKLNAINILADGDAQYLTIFNNAPDDFVINAGATYTNGGYKYTFTQNADNKGVVDVTQGEKIDSVTLTDAGFAAAWKDSGTRAFSATEDVNIREDMGLMIGTELTIFGNKHSINGNGTDRLKIESTTTSPKTLNIYNVGSVDENKNVIASWNGHKGTDDGGALTVIGSTLNINSSVFSDNHCIDIQAGTTLNGGAIFGSDSNLNISNSYFINNSAIHANKASMGGAISAASSNVNIISSYFKNNKAQNGGVLELAGRTANIIGSEFVENTATTNGGAILVSSNTTSINKSTFTKNSAAYGGAMYIEGGSTNISDSIFTENTATTHGGAIYTKYNTGAVVNITNSTFTGNKAIAATYRSEERRVGKECRSRWSPYH